MTDDRATPDLFVLGSGGVLGDVWMTGVVVGLGRTGAVDMAAAGGLVGTSAGSIVATRLATGQDLEALIERHVDAPVESAVTDPPGDLEDPRMPSGLLARMLPLRGLAGRAGRRLLLRLVPDGRQELNHLARDMKDLAPDWPDRLHIVAVNSRTGAPAVFTRGRTQGLSVSEAVQASCAIPSVFKPVEGADGKYVDGGVWSPSNLDAVEAESGQTMVCLSPTGSDQGAVGLRGRFFARLFRSIVDREASLLQARGVRVRQVVPDAAASAAIGPSRMASGREAQVYAAGLAQGLALGEPLGTWLRGGSRKGAALSR